MFLYIWIGVMTVSLIVELCTAGLVSIWFVAGSLIAIILNLLGLTPIWQILGFIVSSILFLVFFRKLFAKHLLGKTIRTNSDAIIGKDLRLILPISFNNPGSVKISGVEWSAISENEMDEIESDSLVRVINIQGNKLIVRKIEEE